MPVYGPIVEEIIGSIDGAICMGEIFLASTTLEVVYALVIWIYAYELDHFQGQLTMLVLEPAINVWLVLIWCDGRHVGSWTWCG